MINRGRDEEGHDNALSCLISDHDKRGVVVRGEEGMEGYELIIITDGQYLYIYSFVLSSDILVIMTLAFFGSVHDTPITCKRGLIRI